MSLNASAISSDEWLPSGRYQVDRLLRDPRMNCAAIRGSTSSRTRPSLRALSINVRTKACHWRPWARTSIARSPVSHFPSLK